MTKIRLTHAFASNLCSLYYDRGFTPSLESTVPAAARRGRGPRKGALGEGSAGRMEEGKAPDQEDGMVEEAGEQEAQDDVGFGAAVRSRFLRLHVLHCLMHETMCLRQHRNHRCNQPPDPVSAVGCAGDQTVEEYLQSYCDRLVKVREGWHEVERLNLRREAETWPCYTSRRSRSMRRRRWRR